MDATLGEQADNEKGGIMSAQFITPPVAAKTPEESAQVEAVIAKLREAGTRLVNDGSEFPSREAARTAGTSMQKNVARTLGVTIKSRTFGLGAPDKDGNATGPFVWALSLKSPLA